MMRIYKVLLVVILVAGVTSCSGDSVESQTDFEFVPSKPVMIATDFSYLVPPLDPQGTATLVTIAGAWFQFDFQFKNPTTKQITITSIEVTGTGRAPDGTEVSSTSAIDTSDHPNNQDSDQTNNRTYLFTVLPGAIATARDAGAPAGVFPIGGFPKQPDVTNNRLQLRVTLYGWVGTPTVPEASYQKILFVTTQ